MGPQPTSQDGSWTAPFTCTCESFWFPCVTWGRTEERIRDPSLRDYDNFNPDCKKYGFANCCGCGWYMTMNQRQELRERYGIQGSSSKDCCSSFWCQPCVQEQNDREVERRTAHLVDKKGYQPEANGMKMPTPEPAPAPAAPATDADLAAAGAKQG